MPPAFEHISKTPKLDYFSVAMTISKSHAIHLRRRWQMLLFFLFSPVTSSADVVIKEIVGGETKPKEFPQPAGVRTSAPPQWEGRIGFHFLSCIKREDDCYVLLPAVFDSGCSAMHSSLQIFRERNKQAFIALYQPL